MSLDNFVKCVDLVVKNSEFNKYYVISRLLELESRISYRESYKDNKDVFSRHYFLLATGYLLKE